MFFVGLATTFIVLGVSCLVYEVWRRRQDNLYKDGPAGFGFFLFFVGAILLLIGLINSMVAYSDQVQRSVELTKIASFEKTYQARANNLTKEFAHYLAEAYPQHEKDIFSKIEPGKLDIYLVKYPELQASKTITELVQQVRSLQDDIYKQQLSRAETVRDMQFTVRSPWVYQWMMPNIPIPTPVQ